MSKKQSDSVFHPSSGFSIPGGAEQNPYIHYPPMDLKKLIESEKDKVELEKMKSALKQWGRLYLWPGYPYRLARKLKLIAARILESEVNGPHPRNMEYYNDEERPQGYGEILDSLRNVHDEDDMVRFDYPRQGIRPIRDIDTGYGDFLSPKEPLFDSVKPRGDGPDPDGMDAEEPPTGGNIDGFPSNIG